MRYSIFIMISGLLYCLQAGAQDGYRLEFNAKFNDDFDRGRKDRRYNAVLSISGNRSRFYMTTKDEYQRSDERDLVFSPDTAFLVYTDQAEGLLLAQEYGVDGKPFILSDSLYPMQWEITSEEKKLQDLNCVKALCRFRGRQYIAWFTPDIPLPFGPWKMGGLPGLIVDLRDSEDNFVITLAQFREVGVNFPKPQPVRATMEQHISDIKKLLARLRSGAKASGYGDCLTCTGQSTYDIYLWEKISQ